MISGSQWWCLRRSTVETLLAFIAETPRSDRAFPHHMDPEPRRFFQTLVRHPGADAEIDSRTRRSDFTDYDAREPSITNALRTAAEQD